MFDSKTASCLIVDQPKQETFKKTKVIITNDQSGLKMIKMIITRKF